MLIFDNRRAFVYSLSKYIERGATSLPFDIEAARRSIHILADNIEKSQDYLSNLDKEVGDGDHGLNMTRGLQQVISRIDAHEYGELGEFFRDVAINFMDAAGGYVGPIFGVLMMKLSRVFMGREAVGAAEIGSALDEGGRAVMALCHAGRGSKSVIDAIMPAAEAITANADRGEAEALQAGADAALEGVNATTAMSADRANANVHPEHGVGTPDPGAVSAAYFVDAIRYAVVGDVLAETFAPREIIYK